MRRIIIDIHPGEELGLFDLLMNGGDLVNEEGLTVSQIKALVDAEIDNAIASIE